MGLAGLAGLMSILWLIASAVFGVQLVIFKTGSMSPSMPTGTAALAVPVQAADIAVGDVLMVQREGTSLPVTHRVVSVEPDPNIDGGGIVVMQGDDNDTADPFPYYISEAHRVFFSVPNAGFALVTARTPLFLGATTLGVAALVMWAFWPRRTEGTHRKTSNTEEVVAEHPSAADRELTEVKS